jgi:hypothetical protein
MRAIVCDCCGKVELLDETGPCVVMTSYRLLGPDESLCIDLCEECAKDIVKATRKEKDYDLP